MLRSILTAHQINLKVQSVISGFHLGVNEILAWRFKMMTIGCTETSMTYYQSTLRNIPEERKIWKDVANKCNKFQ